MRLSSRVRKWLQEEGDDLRPFLPPATKLLIGVSGGPDSLALLHVLRAIYPPDNLVVAHLHHGWRAAADADARFVTATAAAWHIPCHVEKVDVTALARAARLSLEEAGRKARYDFFARLAGEVGAKAVAVGHHADDQAETVLMHLLRGSGLAGLCGMRPVSPLPGAPELSVIRPFLTASRAEIEQYCQENNLQPITDSTNQDTAFFRNRLRHELLPLLTEYNPQIYGRLQQMAAVIRADYDLLDTIMQKEWTAILRGKDPDWLALDRAGWLALPLSLRRSTLRRAVTQLRPDWRDIGFRPIEQARLVAEKGATGGQATLPGGLIMTVGYEQLTIAADPATRPIYLPQLTGETAVPLPVPGRIELANGWMLAAEPIHEMDLVQVQANADPWQAFVDVGKRPLWVRPRRPGEQMQPLGMNGQSAKLKDIMINRKIPVRLRARWPLVTTDEHPVWLAGHLVDERAKVTTVSHPIIHLVSVQGATETLRVLLLRASSYGTKKPLGSERLLHLQCKKSG